MQKKKAISLIVLVITIIVMVVLTGTIIISLNNNGIMTKANNAVKQSNLKEVQTMADTYWGEAYSSGITTQSALDTYVREKLIETLGETEYGNYTVTVTERGTVVDILTGIVLNTSAVTLNIEDEEVAVTTTLTATLKNLEGTITWSTSDENVVSISSTSGNSITVTAVSGGTASITATCGTYNTTCTVTVTEPVRLWAYTKDSNNKYTLVSNGKQTLEIGDTVNYTATGTSYSGAWKVLGADNEGHILIMAAANAETKLLGGSLEQAKSDYANAEDILNGLCEKYGNGTGAISARSITVEDIDRITGYNPLNEGIYDSEKTGVGTKASDYGDSYEYTSGIFYKNGEWVTATNESPVTINKTYYYYDFNVSDKIANMIRKGSYWLASRNVDCKSNNADFNVHYLSGRSVYSQRLVNSSGFSSCGAQGVRPVVTLESSVRLTGSSSTGWTIQ